jgi:hypothetical protein
LDPVLEAQISPLALWDNHARGLHALEPFSLNRVRSDSLQFERCGVTQRVSYHNRDCVTALAALGRGDLVPRVNQGYDPSTGTEVTFSVTPDEMRCSVREEVHVKTLCEQGSCNANGLCSRYDAPPVVLHDVPKPL